MIVVVDSNIVFSSLLSKNSFLLETLLKEEHQFVAISCLQKYLSTKKKY